MSRILPIIAIVIAVGALGFLTWAANSRWAADRNWVYNRHNPRPPGVGSLGLLETIYQPSMEHVIEERASEKARGSQDESGQDGSSPDP